MTFLGFLVFRSAQAGRRRDHQRISGSWASSLKIITGDNALVAATVGQAGRAGRPQRPDRARTSHR